MATAVLTGETAALPGPSARSAVYGLLQAALAPQATAFGALLHSLARNHALIDDSKRLALAVADHSIE